MIKYKLKNGNILKDGHTMFLEDVVSDLQRKEYLESLMKDYIRWTRTQALIKTAEKLVVSIKTTNTSDVGKLKIYKKGDIVVWLGDDPCIGEIYEDFDCSKATCRNDEMAHIKDFSSNLSYQCLRLATEKEIEIYNDDAHSIFKIR